MANNRHLRSQNDHIAVMQRSYSIKSNTRIPDLVNPRNYDELVLVAENYVNRALCRRAAAIERRENRKKGNRNNGR
ncbi:hypothetical protein [Xenorhabdus griffiniae]|uniref:Phage protein n=1 Tax=Xenorhabdus griffiniae TaxID=351672 RepID=A0ABY9XKR9_9GAMM|nr:hypothetical protein [Xenorhabdus griffiniae]MBD1228585.1 hypothetical protein [Xenorhabdus griffiniae]MBE8588678.1 hypothetical protein [Xenorhabdus griffiniae]WMV73456.1 hypothetical protein QL128_05370 [Xenorhabdus griffiniae]WNH03135.1 hypothetical protein QL112_005375 [Xenorhabdus griffiniae]